MHSTGITKLNACSFSFKREEMFINISRTQYNNRINTVMSVCELFVVLRLLELLGLCSMDQLAYVSAYFHLFCCCSARSTPPRKKECHQVKKCTWSVSVCCLTVI